MESNIKPMFANKMYFYIVISMILMQSGINQLLCQKLAESFSGNFKFKTGSFGAILIRNDTITMGTDSRILSVKYDSLVSLTDTACKSYAINNTIFAIIGNNGNDSINVSNQAKLIFSLRIPIKDRITKINKFAISFLNYIIKNPYWKQLLLNSEELRNKISIHIIVGVFTNNIPTIFDYLCLPTIKNSDIIIIPDSVNYIIPNDKYACLPFGENAGSEETQNFIKSLNPILSFANPSTVVKHIIENQIKMDKTNSIGGFIDVIQLTKNGYKWLYKKQNCID